MGLGLRFERGNLQLTEDKVYLASNLPLDRQREMIDYWRDFCMVRYCHDFGGQGTNISSGPRRI